MQLDNFDKRHEYQTQIAPLLNELLARCRAHGIPLVCVMVQAAQDRTEDISRVDLVGAKLLPPTRTPYKLEALTELIDMPESCIVEAMIAAHGQDEKRIDKTARELLDY